MMNTDTGMTFSVRDLLTGISITELMLLSTKYTYCYSNSYDLSRENCFQT
jgi:hypothetical protein